MDLYFHNALEEITKDDKELERLRVKTKKFSQLAQKLYNLSWIEKRLISRK